NYRVLARRLQLELEAATDVQGLQHAARVTRLGLRTSRPRVYVFVSLGGGSGSGMLVDAAYTVRAVLRQMGHENPDVVGVLLVPPVDSSRTRHHALSNTYAALSELRHYGAPGNTFQAKYHDREPAIQDAGPPFSRTVVVELPEEGDEVATREVIELVSQMVKREVTTPFGKNADLGRAGLPSPPWEARGQYFSTFGLFQLTWPRHATLSAVARRLCIQTVKRWASKDSKPIREPIKEWVHGQWAEHELAADSFIHRLQAGLIKALGKPAESAFAAVVDPLKPGSAQGEGRRTGSRGGPVGLEVGRLAAAVDELDKLLGKPNDEHPPEEPPVLPALLRRQADALAAEWSQRLAEMAVRLIEEPAFRLAGAEEAIRQTVALVEQVLQHHEPLAADLTQKAAEAYRALRLASAPAEKGHRRPALNWAEAYELLRTYPKWRLQSMILAHLSAAFVGLRGHLSDSLREVNFCRVRLAELLRMFEEVPPEEKSQSAQGVASREEGIGRQLFLSGCRSLNEAVELHLREVGAEHLLDLDARMEDMLKGSFTALVHFCLTNQNIIRDVHAAMIRTARDYAAETHPTVSTGELFFEQHPDDDDAEREVADYFNEAAPGISATRSPHAGPPVSELCVVATPDGPDGAKFRSLLARAAPEVEVQPASSPDDILIYRERINLPFAVLGQCGPTAHDAYLQMTSAEVTPHSRTD
ncbi:MAG: tubulin-like doman-containing protein, partial [Gemmataceae bacterium]